MGLDRERTCPGHRRVAAEQVDDEQLSSGLRGEGGFHFGGLLGLRETLKKRQPHLELRWGLWCERDLVGGV